MGEPGAVARHKFGEGGRSTLCEKLRAVQVASTRKRKERRKNVKGHDTLKSTGGQEDLLDNALEEKRRKTEKLAISTHMPSVDSKTSRKYWGKGGGPWVSKND